jgi:hypothetical protein
MLTLSSSDLCLTLAKSCSATRLAISRFSSLRFINAAYDSQRIESSHPFFTCVSYFNFALSGQSSVVFYGTDKALDCLWEQWPSFVERRHVRTVHPQFAWLIFHKFYLGITPNVPHQIEEEQTLSGAPLDTIHLTRDNIMACMLSTSERRC